MARLTSAAVVCLDEGYTVHSDVARAEATLLDVTGQPTGNTASLIKLDKAGQGSQGGLAGEQLGMSKGAADNAIRR